MHKKTSKVKQTILAISIAIVFAMFVGYGIATFYEDPEYSDYCKERPYIPRTIEKGINSSSCPEIDESSPIIKDCTEKKGYIEYDYDGNNCPVDPTCNTCYADYDKADEAYSKVVFVITLIIGLIAIIVGAILEHESVSPGVMGGGALTIFYGTLRYWGHAPDALRFTLLGVVLIVLIWLGYKKFKSN